jgi:DegV family protein with EDD domain
VIHIVTDSTSDISQADAKALGVTVVPLTVRFGEEQFRDGIDIDSDGFYRKLQSTSVHPTTSQPTPEQFRQAYEPLLKQPGDSIVSMHISSKLSGTLQSANIAAQELASDRIHLVDTESASAGIQLLLRAALGDIAAGRDVREVVSAIERRRSRVIIYVLLDTLTYLHRGGRIGRARAMFGTVLSVKPVLTVLDGEVAPQARVRSTKQGVETILSLLRERMPLRALAAFHCGSPQLLEPFLAQLREIAPDIDILRGQVGPVIGAYTGPGGIGIACIDEGGKGSRLERPPF